MDPILSVQQLTKLQDVKPIVNKVSFVLSSGQKMAIVGETGSGKSSLLKMITGHLQPDGGQVLFNNKRVEGPLEKLIPGHPQMAYLSQYFELRNNYWVYEELSYTNQLTDEEANTIYDICQITHLLQRRTNQLSGGEKQRIALARQLIKKPALLVLDEPFSNLDPVHKQTIKTVLQHVTTKLGITTLLVSHDALDTLSWANELLVMKDGVIIQQGSPETVYNQPVNEYCAGLLGAYNFITINNEAFKNLDGFNWATNGFIIRPENLQLHNAHHSYLITGIVISVLFLGSFYMVQVQVGEQLIQFSSAAYNLPAIGATVQLGFNKANVHFVQ